MNINIKVPVKTTKQYITLMSGLLRLTGSGLTDMEIEILSVFVDLTLEIERIGLGVNAFSAEMKKEAAKRLDREDFGTLNNYIKSLHDKKVIQKVAGGYQVIKVLVPQPSISSITIKLS